MGRQDVSTDMTFKLVVIGALLLLGAAPTVRAQTNGDASAAAVGTTGVDVSRLPINLQRIQREVRQATIREERAGLNLRYFVEVYGQAPRLQVLDPQRDNLQFGPTPHGAPTHRDMLWMLTPPEHRGSLYALPLFRVPIGGSKKDK